MKELPVLPCTPRHERPFGFEMMGLMLALCLIGCSAAQTPGTTDEWSTLPTARLGVSNADASDFSIVVDRFGGATLHGDGSIVVADASSRQITFLDASGRVQRDAGGGGSGPGEFEALNAPLPCGDGHVLFWDERVRRASRWSASGELVESFAVANGPTNASFAVGAERDCSGLLFYTWDPRSRPAAGTARMRAALLRVSLGGAAAVDTVFALDGDEMEVLATPTGRTQHARVLFSSTPMVVGRAGLLVRANGEPPEAELFRSASTPVERVAWSETPRPASDAAVALIDESRETFRQRYPDQAPFIPAARDQSRRESLPAIDRILIGADSSVWLRRYRIIDTGLGTDVDPSPEAWLVVPHGSGRRFVATLSRGLSLVAVGSSHALVRTAVNEGDRVVRVAIPEPQP